MGLDRGKSRGGAYRGRVKTRQRWEGCGERKVGPCACKGRGGRVRENNVPDDRELTED